MRRLAGALTALALAIGLENILFVALAGAAHGAAVSAVAPRAARALAHYGAALAAGALIGFRLSCHRRTGCGRPATPWRSTGRCPVVVAGAGLWAAATFTTHPRARLAAVVLIGAVCTRSRGWPSSRAVCWGRLRSPTTRSSCCGSTGSTRPRRFVSVLRNLPMTAAWLVAFPLVGMLATFALSRDPQRRHDFGFWLAAAALAARARAHLRRGQDLCLCHVVRHAGSGGARRAPARLVTAAHRCDARGRGLLLTPTVVTASAITIAQAAGGEATRARPCRSHRLLAQRRLCRAGATAGGSGRDRDQLRSVRAGAHAACGGRARRITASPAASSRRTPSQGTPDEARAAVAAHGANYVAICGQHTSTGVDPAPAAVGGTARRTRAGVARGGDPDERRSAPLRSIACVDWHRPRVRGRRWRPTTCGSQASARSGCGRPRVQVDAVPGIIFGRKRRVVHDRADAARAQLRHHGVDVAVRCALLPRKRRSLPPGWMMTRRVPFGTAELMRPSMPLVVSNGTPALTTCAGMPRAFSSASSRAG